MRTFKNGHRTGGKSINLYNLRVIISPTEHIEIYKNMIFSPQNYVFDGDADVLYNIYTKEALQNAQIFQIVSAKQGLVIILKGDLWKTNI